MQVLDANGRTLYGAYTRITDGQLNVGQAGRGSRADEPTGGSHYTVYTYDLTNNPALGTFLVDESYNRDFWKTNGLGLYSETQKVTETIPDNIDTSTVTTLYDGTYNLDKSETDGWEKPLSVDNSFFKTSNNNHFKVTVSGKINNRNVDPTYFFLLRS